MISDFYTTTVSTQRLTAVSGTKKEAFTALLTDLACSIQPVEGTPTEMLSGGFYSTFKMFCPSSTDIEVGDRVIDGSTTYVVKGEKTYSFAGSTTIRHKILTLVIPEA